MGAFIDITGNRYGKLLVQSRAENINGNAAWVCLCDCGNTCTVVGYSLKSGDTKSCGCYHKEALRNRHKTLVGKVFDRLTVVEELKERNKQGRYLYRCKCVCGNEVISADNNLTSGDTKSCGCKNIENITKHGMANSPEYKTWTRIKQRCLNPKNTSYKYYGAKGITVANEWVQSFDTFLKDMGRRPSDAYSIDRIDNTKGYSKENCRWATREIQDNNTSRNILLTYKGVTMNVTQWAKKLGMKPHSLQSRLYLGWSIERALTTPIKSKCNQK